MTKKGTIGIKTEIEGSAKFKQEIKDINTSMRTLKSELELVTSQYDKNDVSVEKIVAQSKVYAKILNEQQQKVKKVSEALKYVTDKYGENDSRTQKWKQSLNKAQKEVNDTQRSIDKLADALNEQQKEMEQSEDNSEKLKKALKTLGISEDSASNKTIKFGDVLKANLASEAIISGIKKLSNGLKEVSGKAIEAGSNFKKSMSTVAATMGITSDEIRNGSDDYEKLKATAEKMGASTKYTATQAGDALNYMALAGYNVEEAIGTLPSVLNLASAGDMDLATASDQVTDAMGALGLSVNDTAKFVDKMAKTSQKSNTNVQQLGEAILTVGGTAKNLKGGVTELDTALGLLANTGIKGAEGGTKLRNIILALNPTTDKATKAWKQLKVSAYDANGSLKPLSQTFSELNDKLSTMSAQERTEYLSKMFNKQDLKAVESLLGQCGDAWNELSENIENSNGCATEMANTLQDNLQGKITILKSSLEGLGITIFDIFDNDLKKGVDSATNSVTRIKNEIKNGELTATFESLSKSVDSAIEQALNFGEKALPVVIDGLSWVLNNIDVIIAGVNGLATAMLAKKSYDMILKGVEAYKAMKVVIEMLTTKTIAQTVATEGATVAQEGLNVAMSSNVIGLVISAIAGLTATLISLGITFDDKKEKTNEFTNEIERLKESTNKTTEEINDLSKSFKNSMSNVEAQAEQAQLLTDKLYALADKENKTNAEKQQMIALVKSLNEQLPEMNLQIDEQTGKLSKQKDVIYDLINANKEQAIAQAYQKNYTQIAEKQAVAQQNIYEAEKQRSAITKELQTAYNDLSNATIVATKKYENFADCGVRVERATRAQKERLDSLKKSQEDCSNVIADNTKIVDSCGKEWEETGKLIEQQSQKIKDADDKVGDSSSIMSKELQENLDKAKEAYRNSYKEAQSSLQGTMKLFDEVAKAPKKSANELQKNLDDQIKKIDQYRKNIKNLSNRVSDDFIKTLKDMGIESADEINTLASMSDEQLKKYEETWRKKQKAINKTSKELTKDKQKDINEIEKQIAENSEKNAQDLVDKSTEPLNNIKSQTTQFGKDYGQGLINGMASMRPNVKHTAENISQSILDTTQSTLDIHSPSRKATTFGEQYSIGLGNGIRNKKKYVKSSAAEVSEIILQTAEKHLDNLKVLKNVSLQDEIEYWKNIYNQTSKGTQARIDVYKHYKDAKQALREAEKKKDEESQRKETEKYDKILSNAKTKLDNLKVYKNVSTEYEMKYWNTIRQEFSEGTQNRIDADKLYFEARKAYLEEDKKKVEEAKKDEEDKNDKLLSDAKKTLENKKVYNEISLKDETNYWNKVRKQFKKGTQNRIDADKLYLDAKKAYQEELKSINDAEIKDEQEKIEKIKSINDTYQETVENTKKEMQESISDIKEKYNNTLNSRIASLSGTWGIFDAYTPNDKNKYLTGQLLQQNLTSQVRELEDYTENMDKLRSRGIDSDFVDMIEEMGVNANDQIKAINSMTDEQLDEYVRTWKYKNELARQESDKQLKDLKEETETNINEIVNNTNKTLANAYDNYMSELEKEQEKTSKKMSKIADLYKAYGENIANSFFRGLANKMPNSESTLTGLFLKQDDTPTNLNLNLKKMENETKNNNNNFDISNKIASAMSNAISKLSVVLDGEKIGNVVDERIISNL